MVDTRPVLLRNKYWVFGRLQQGGTVFDSEVEPDSLIAAAVTLEQDRRSNLLNLLCRELDCISGTERGFHGTCCCRLVDTGATGIYWCPTTALFPMP